MINCLHYAQYTPSIFFIIIHFVQFAANECSGTSASPIPSECRAVDWTRHRCSLCKSCGKWGGSTLRCSLSDALPLENSTRGETPSPRKQGASAGSPLSHSPATASPPWLIRVYYWWWISANSDIAFCARWRVCIHHTNARGHSSAAVQQVVPLPVIWGKCVRPEVRAALCSQPGHLSAFVPVTSSAQAPAKREIVNSPERPSVEIRA